MKHKIKVRAWLVLTALFAFGCKDPAATSCGQDGSYSEDDLGAYCAYAVIAGGFSCPVALPFRFEVGLPGGGSGVVCTNRSSGGSEDFELPSDACRSLGAAPSCRVRSAATAALVNDCITLATRFRDLCAESNGETSERVCLWEAYRDLCRTGNTQLLVDSMECLDINFCRTFSDANDGNACLNELHARAQPATVRERIVSQCTQCGGDCSTSFGQGEIIPYLPSSEFQELASCGLEACTLDDLLSECSDVGPSFERFNQCT